MDSYWDHPPIIKIYEALGSVADGRLKISGNSAKVYSSSGNKYYDVVYDPGLAAIAVNDNASFYKGYLGYPAVAYLLTAGVLTYQPHAAELLKGIAWKDINVRFKNDFNKTLEYILNQLAAKDRAELEKEAQKIDIQLKVLKLKKLGEQARPPEGY
jgi:hypothetical protein